MKESSKEVSYYITNEEFAALRDSSSGELWVKLRAIALNSLSAFRDLNHEEKSDAFTKGFEKFFTALRRAKTPAEIVRFVVRGTRWNARDALKAKRRRGAREVSYDECVVNDDSERATEPSLWEFSVVLADMANAERERDRREVLAELDELLTEEQKVLCDLLFVRDLDRRAIAKVLDTTPGAVSAAKCRLLAVFREIAASWRRAEKLAKITSVNL